MTELANEFKEFVQLTFRDFWAWLTFWLSANFRSTKKHQAMLVRQFIEMIKDPSVFDQAVFEQCEVLLNTRPHFRIGDEAHAAMVEHRPYLKSCIRYLACP